MTVLVFLETFPSWNLNLRWQRSETKKLDLPRTKTEQSSTGSLFQVFTDQIFFITLAGINRPPVSAAFLSLL